MASKLIPSLFQIDRSQIYWKQALRRVPVPVLALLVGVLSGQPAVGVLAAGTALPVGFAGTRQVRGSRLLAMVATTLFMAVSALSGTLAGDHRHLVLIATLLWGFVCGLLTILNDDLGWIALQGVIAFLVATAFPSEGIYALGRALFILLGGSAQIVSLLGLWRAAGISRFGSEVAAPGTPRAVSLPFEEVWNHFRLTWKPTSVAFRYAMRVALTLVGAVALDHALHLKNGYWLPMTTIIVLKPDFYRTYNGGIQRMVGTLAGVIAASLLTMVLRPHALVLVVLAGIFGFFTFFSQKVNAVLFSAALTSFVVFMIATTGLPEASVTWHRLINTVLGCGLALLSRLIGLGFFKRPSGTAAVAVSGEGFLTGGT